MNIFRNRILKSLALLALLVMAGHVYAQGKFKDVFAVTDSLKKKKISCTDSLIFLKETNELEIDKNLHIIINNDTTDVWVAALVCNQTGCKNGQGDYTTYWKDRKATANRYTWVFIPEDFMQKVRNKNIDAITDSTQLSDRLSKLLGLNIGIQRDTIVYMKVPKDSLFRPAYNPSIYKRVESVTNADINRLPPADKYWMCIQQLTNNYPWTRMGYTYDWGSENDPIGVAEFVIRPKTAIRNLNFITTKQIKNGWPNKK